MLETKNNQNVKTITKTTFLLLFLAVISVLPATVFADESWTSNVGNISYEDDANNTAIFLFASPAGGKTVDSMPR